MMEGISTGEEDYLYRDLDTFMDLAEAWLPDIPSQMVVIEIWMPIGTMVDLVITRDLIRHPTRDGWKFSDRAGLLLEDYRHRWIFAYNIFNVLLDDPPMSWPFGSGTEGTRFSYWREYQQPTSGGMVTGSQVAYLAASTSPTL